MSDALYLPTADPSVFRATEHTIGPWDEGAQHGGPPSALLTRTIERLPSSIAGPSQLARLTFEILGPVPVADVTVSATVARPGRTVELVEAELESGGRVAIRARAWRIRTTELALPDHIAKPATAPPIPTQEGPQPARTGYLSAVDFRFVSGQFHEPGPADVWSRLRVPVIAGEEPSATQRLVAAADSGNGLSGLLDFANWWYINTDLSLHFHRLPVGEWIFLSAQSTLDNSGVGLAETELFDEHGRVGRGAQALMVGPRPVAGPR